MSRRTASPVDVRAQTSDLRTPEGQYRSERRYRSTTGEPPPRASPHPESEPGNGADRWYLQISGLEEDLKWVVHMSCRSEGRWMLAPRGRRVGEGRSYLG